MKLATYKDGSRDGQLVVVSRDLATAHYANGIASRLQQVLDDWNFLSPQLEDLFVTLNQGRARHAFAFDSRQCMAPLPRAFLCVSTLGDTEPGGRATPETAPPLLACPGDDLQGPHDPAWFGLAGSDGADLQIDCEPGLAVATGDLARAASPAQALDCVRLLLLTGHWRLRSVLADERAAGRPPLLGLAATACAPVAVTPDELGAAWHGGRVRGQLQLRRNGRALAAVDSADAMAWHFGELLAHLARTRRLRAGALVGCGLLWAGAAATGVADPAATLALGDTLRIGFSAPDGADVFGAIEQTVAGPAAAETPATPQAPASADTRAPAPGLAGPADA